MGNNHDEKEYHDLNGDKCGKDWPNDDGGTDSTAHEGVGGSTGMTCDGLKKDNVTAWPPNRTGSNACGAHRAGRTEGNFSGKSGVGQEKVIIRDDIDKLNELIKDELSNGIWKAGSYANKTHKINARLADFKGMRDIIIKAYNNAKETDISVNLANTFNGKYIMADDVSKLIKAYEKMVGDCICNADCGANTTCSCHNNCGCHY